MFGSDDPVTREQEAAVEMRRFKIVKLLFISGLTAECKFSMDFPLQKLLKQCSNKIMVKIKECADIAAAIYGTVSRNARYKAESFKTLC